MELSNTAWSLIAANTTTTLEMQNTGTTRIAYVYGSDLPQSDNPANPNYVALDTDDHFILAPGMEPFAYRGGATAIGSNVYGRSLGPKPGQLALRRIP